MIAPPAPPPRLPQPGREAPSGSRVQFARRAGATVFLADALGLYRDWPAPVVIVSDGAYGVSGFPGDTPGPDGLADWYRPHIKQWSRAATGETTLWFWNTEVGWATVHPLPSFKSVAEI